MEDRGTGVVVRHGVGRAGQQRGLLRAPLARAASGLVHGQRAAAVGLRLGPGLEGEALEQAPGEAAGLLPGGRAGSGVGQVVVGLAEPSLLLLVLPPEDEFGAASQKVHCERRSQKPSAAALDGQSLTILMGVGRTYGILSLVGRLEDPTQNPDLSQEICTLPTNHSTH